MPQTNGNGNGHADRYEQAATETLEMLDWCIGYFVAIRKAHIASRLESGRLYIKEDLMHRRAEPLPTSKSGNGSHRGESDGEKRSPGNNGDGGSGRSEDYREAATEALEMLDWSIGYLVGARKYAIGAQLARNRKHIREDLMHEPAEPVPMSDE